MGLGSGVGVVSICCFGGTSVASFGCVGVGGVVSCCLIVGTGSLGSVDFRAGSVGGCFIVLIRTIYGKVYNYVYIGEVTNLASSWVSREFFG